MTGPRAVLYPSMLTRSARATLSLLVVALALVVAAPAWAAPRSGPRDAAIAALSRALVAGHVAAYRTRPTPARLRVALAQVMLETGRGRRWCGGNVGQLGAGRGEPRCRVPGRHGASVRRYRSAAAGARAYWRLPAVVRALPAFDAGDPATAARMLGAGGYYRAPVDTYAAGMVAIHAELSRRDGGASR